MKLLNLLFPLFCCILSLTAQQNTLSLDELDSLTVLHTNQVQFQKAIHYAKLSVAKAEKQYAGKDSIYIQYLFQYSDLLALTNNYADAEKILYQALSILPTITSNKDYWEAKTRLRLSSVYFRTGKFEKSESLAKESIKLNTALLGANHIELCNDYNLLSMIYRGMDRLEEALLLQKKSLNIIIETYGEESIEAGLALMNSASLSRGLREYKTSEELYKRAEQAIIKVYGVEHPQYARLLNNMGLLYKTMKEYDKAEKMYWEGHRIRKKVLGPNHYRVATVLGNIALLYVNTDRYEEAEELMIEALAINIKALGEKHPRVSSNYLSLVAIKFKLNKVVEIPNLIFKGLLSNTVSNFDQSIDPMMLVKNYDFKNPSFTINFLSQSAEYHNQNYKKSKDLLDLKKVYQNFVAISYYINLAQNKISLNSDKLRLLRFAPKSAQSGIQHAYDLYALTKDFKYLEQILRFAEGNKSAILSSTIHADEALNFGEVPDSLIRKEQNIDREMAEINSKLLGMAERGDSAVKKTLQNALLEIQLEKDDFKKHLESKYPKYTKLRYHTEELDVKNIQNNLITKDLALIEYFIYDSLLYIIALTEDKIVVKKVPFDREERNQKIKQFRKSLSDYDFILHEKEKALVLYTQTAYSLYQKLIEPIEPILKDAKHLIIIPDGELGHIPFEALLYENSPKEKTYSDLAYLLKKYNISYNYSATLWKENHELKMDNYSDKIIAFAASYEKKALDQSVQRSNRPQKLRNLRDALQDLPAVKLEVKKLEELFNGTFLYDDAANEQQFKEKAAKAGIIHLAMHGLLNKKNPMLSALAFTENKDTVDDNFLYAHEISQLQLKAQLVVLSACETGYGKFQHGEGVMSLARSFMYAGVSSLVVSLWQVNDASTSNIMQLFYKNLAKGMDKAEALRQAKLTYIKKAAALSSGSNSDIAAHPAFWAPFIQLGDSRPIKISQKSTVYWYWGAIAAGLLLLGGLGWKAMYRQK